VCGWTDEQAQRQLWGRSGMWARVKSVGFEAFLKAAIRFHWPIGYDHGAELQLVSQQTEERHRAAAKQAIELHVEIESASNLPAKDVWSRSSDPYCKVSFNRQWRQTEPKNRTLDPHWGTSFHFHIQDPAGVTPLVVELLDHDFLTSDDEIGTVSLTDDTMRSILDAPRKEGKSAVKKLELSIRDNDGKEVTGHHGKTSMLTIRIHTQDHDPRSAPPVEQVQAPGALNNFSSTSGSGSSSTSKSQQPILVLCVTVHQGKHFPPPHQGLSNSPLRSPLARGRGGRGKGMGEGEEGGGRGVGVEEEYSPVVGVTFEEHTRETPRLKARLNSPSQLTDGIVSWEETFVFPIFAHVHAPGGQGGGGGGGWRRSTHLL